MAAVEFQMEAASGTVKAHSWRDKVMVSILDRCSHSICSHEPGVGPGVFSNVLFRVCHLILNFFLLQEAEDICDRVFTKEREMGSFVFVLS